MNNNHHYNTSILRLILKSISLFLVFNLVFIALSDIPYGKISFYNTLFLGRERLPFGENPEKSYNITMNNLDAMVGSQKISNTKNVRDHYKIVVIGDSSVWGFLQTPENTLAGLLDTNIDFQCRSKPIEVFNLGYPSLSILKDIMIIEKISEFNPDLIIWLVTLESFPLKYQTDTPLVKNNPKETNRIIKKYALNIPLFEINPLDFSIIGQRRNLSDILRLQFYGFMWSATGIDQEYPEKYNPAQRDFKEDLSFKDFEYPDLDTEDLAIEMIKKTVSTLSDVNFVIINEPILISNGENSHIRYNHYYPRWAYDAYREILDNEMVESGIKYYDFWDIVPETEFTNSAIHLTTAGERILADNIKDMIENHCLTQGNQ